MPSTDAAPPPGRRSGPDEGTGFALDGLDLGQGRLRLRLSGRLVLADARLLWERCHALLRPLPAALLIDLGEVTALDGGCAALLARVQAELAAQDVPVQTVGAKDAVATVLSLYLVPGVQPARVLRPRPVRLLEQVGEVSSDFGHQVGSILSYVGDVAAALGGALRRPRSIHWADLGRLMERTGADALPIVALLAFLIGLVSAYMAAGELHRLGADLFVADLVSVSVVREMGPLITAILVAGRSGAGFAAELGSMRVNEEIDALRTLGLDPVRFLVVPRLAALVLVLPLLTLLADVVAVLGGLLVAVLELDVTPAAFVNEARGALDTWDLGTGLIKSLAFAVVIGLVSCQRGLATRGGAEGVGRSTTSSVVTILFHLVVVTSALTILFRRWGL